MSKHTTILTLLRYTIRVCVRCLCVCCICAFCALITGCGHEQDNTERQEELAIEMRRCSSKSSNSNAVLALSEDEAEIDNNSYYIYGEYGSDFYVAARYTSSDLWDLTGMAEFRLYYEKFPIAVTLLPDIRRSPYSGVEAYTVYYVDINADEYKDLVIVGNEGDMSGDYSCIYAYDIENAEEIVIVDRAGERSQRSLFWAYNSMLTQKQLADAAALKLCKEDKSYQKYADDFDSLSFHRIPGEPVSMGAGNVYIDEDGCVYFRRRYMGDVAFDYVSLIKTVYNKTEGTFDVVSMIVEKIMGEQVYFQLQK